MASTPGTPMTVGAGAPGGGDDPGGTGLAAAAEEAAAPVLILTSPWEGDIDLTTKQGKALWDEGIKPLENKFTGKGNDVIRFLADIKNRADKCKWKSILTINHQSLLTHYGSIDTDDVTTARDDRDLAVVTDLATARPKINALMMYYFLYENSQSPNNICTQDSATIAAVSAFNILGPSPIGKELLSPRIFSCSNSENALLILLRLPTLLSGSLTILDCSARACKIDCLIHQTA